MSKTVPAPWLAWLGPALGGLCLGLLGCASPPVPAEGPVPTAGPREQPVGTMSNGSASGTSSVQALPASERCATPPCPPSGSPGGPAPPPSTANGGATTAAAPFPPAPFAALHERTAQPDDGRWQAYGPLGPSAAPAMVKATVHPNPYKKYVFAIVIALDLSKLELRIVPGEEEPKSTVVPAERRTGLIPASDHAALVAVFNGGFMARHGKHGMRVGDDLFLPPQDDTCTIAFLRDGSLRIRSWPALRAEEGSFSAWRQAPPCLVEQGVVHPELPTEHGNRRWGAAEDGKRDVRRSALCLDRSGRVAMYGFGDYITATELAQALRQAGGYDCAELDINWSYTRFFLVDQATSPPTLGESLVEKLEYSKHSYISKPYYKDFFYLVRRDAARLPP